MATQTQHNNVVNYAYDLVRHLLGETPVEPFTITTKGTEGKVTIPNHISLSKVSPEYHSFRFTEDKVQISFGVN